MPGYGHNKSKGVVGQACIWQVSACDIGALLEEDAWLHLSEVTQALDAVSGKL